MSPLLCSLLLAAANPMESGAAIPVHSVVIGYIDDAELAFVEPGIVQQVPIEPGMRVTEGQMLARLESTEAQLQVERVQAELMMARQRAENDLSVQLATKSLEVAHTELQRALKSNERYPDTVSSSEIDRLTLSVEEARLQVEQANRDLKQHALQVQLKEVELRIADQKLQQRVLRAPHAGIVVSVEHQPGEWTQPDQAFCRLVSLNRVRAEGFVDAADGDVQTGHSVTVQFTSPVTGEPTSFRGRITFVDPQIDTITGQYRVWAEIQNPHAALRPGHHPQMWIETPGTVEKQSTGDRTE